MPNSGQVVVNVPEELKPIRMQLGPDGRVTISYENQMVLADSLRCV
jgi:hypothetical protein